MIKSLALVLCFNSIYCQEGLVHSGNESNIIDFSYSACLNVQACYQDDGRIHQWICGASILNQRLLLTAAHCVHRCSRDSSMMVQFGSGDRTKAGVGFIQKFKEHKCYDENTSQCDIALLKLLSPLTLSNAVGRVVIYPNKYVSHGEEGLVAGWGYVKKAPERLYILQHTTQKILGHEKCQSIMKERIPPGTICGMELGKKSYITGGDSGSALVVERYIQVGLVSLKLPSSKSIVVYTDVGYHFSWIKNTAINIFCNDHLPIISEKSCHHV